MDTFHSIQSRMLFKHVISDEKSAFHSHDTAQSTRKSEEQRKDHFNGLERNELLENRHDREVIDFSRVDESIEKYGSLKELVYSANNVAIYADRETEEAYFDHVFRRGLGMDLHRNVDESHSYEDLVDHLAAVNSELDGSALEEARISYLLNFTGDDIYET